MQSVGCLAIALHWRRRREKSNLRNKTNTFQMLFTFPHKLPMILSQYISCSAQLDGVDIGRDHEGKEVAVLFDWRLCLSCISSDVLHALPRFDTPAYLEFFWSSSFFETVNERSYPWV